MRFLITATALAFSLTPLAGGLAAPAPANQAAPAAATPSTTPSPAPAPPNSDAAAKHAKRTACLKGAKAKKLVGGEKTAYIKNCVAAS
jgi:hypothetical protein